MNFKTIALASAVGGLLALGSASAGEEGAKGEKGAQEKCAGIVKAGKNACATGKHSCAGMAKTDNEPDEWMLVPKGQCEKMGGKLVTEEAKM